ncbi:MAG: hypothetical protein ACKPKO_43630, partial [Candidatus Fonsibacter sp.]
DQELEEVSALLLVTDRSFIGAEDLPVGSLVVLGLFHALSSGALLCRWRAAHRIDHPLQRLGPRHRALVVGLAVSVLTSGYLCSGFELRYRWSVLLVKCFDAAAVYCETFVMFSHVKTKLLAVGDGTVWRACLVDPLMP